MNICILTFVPVLALAASPHRPQEPSEGKQLLEIPMRDGAKLAADLYLPSDYSKQKYPGGLPTMLITTPYDRTREGPAKIWRECFLRNGYAFVAQDMRGMYASSAGGKGASRHGDGYDTIEWIAKQPWSNGKIGMLGYSHLGAVQYETAITTPPHFTCAIPSQAPANYYTDSYFPEKFRKADMETLLRGQFTSRTEQLLNRRTRSRESIDISQFNIPMIHSGGWFDFYKEGGVEMFRACQRDGGPGAKGNQKLILGPWGHGVLQEQDPGTPLTLPGGHTFPANAKFDWEKEIWLPWFNHWLKGKQTGVMARPAVMYYLMGDVDDPKAPGNRWVTADDFPPKSTTALFYAHSDHTLKTTAPSKESDSLSYVYDPKDPVPTVGRVHARMPVNGPLDQREVEGRKDVLLFTTPKLDSPIEIVGQVLVKVWASSDQKDTDFTAKLTDVYPDGRSMIFLDSIVKGRYRNTYLKEELLTPGEIYEFDIDLGYIAIALAKGHSLRLAISSSNFDRFDINPNTGEPYGDHALSRELMAKRLRGYEPRGEPEYTKAVAAKNTVFLDRKHPTHVILPVTSSR